MSEFRLGFAAFQDGTYELFIRNQDNCIEWNTEGTWDEKSIKIMNQVFYPCVICHADQDNDDFKHKFSKKPLLHQDPVLDGLKILSDTLSKREKVIVANAIDEIIRLRETIVNGGE